MESSPQELIQLLQEELGHTDYQTTPQQNEWNQRYFSEHKYRYISDLQFIQRLYKEGPILELGSLPCHLTYCLEKTLLPYTAVDLAPERASTIIRRNQLNVIKADIENESLPFSTENFSFAIFNEVFEHLRINPINTLREINRALGHEGTLLLTTPNLYSLGNIIRFLCGKGFGSPYTEFEKVEKYGHMGHVREYSVRDMKEFLNRTGFSVLEQHFSYYTSTKKSLKEYVKRFIYGILIPFSPYLIIIAKKK